MSADYDKVAGFFEDLRSYLSRLKILENNIPQIPELWDKQKKKTNVPTRFVWMYFVQIAQRTRIDVKTSASTTFRCVSTPESVQRPLKLED